MTSLDIVTVYKKPVSDEAVVASLDAFKEWSRDKRSMESLDRFAGLTVKALENVLRLQEPIAHVEVGLTALDNYDTKLVVVGRELPDGRTVLFATKKDRSDVGISFDMDDAMVVGTTQAEALKQLETQLRGAQGITVHKFYTSMN